MLGFLAPGAHRILQLEEASNGNKNFFFIPSHGKLMDKRFSELLDFLEVDHAFISDKTPMEQLENATEIVPARWDVTLARVHYYKSARGFRKLKLLLNILIKWRWNDGFFLKRSKIADQIVDFRQRIFSRIGAENLKPEILADIILLKRVDETKEYDAQRALQDKDYDYGSKRRSLTNLDYGLQELRAKNHNTAIYEPGYKSMMGQIAQFNKSNTIIGIRGAELAHTIWMPEGSKVVIIDNFPGTTTTNPSVVLANFVDIRFEIIRSDLRPYVPMDDELLGEILRRLA